MRRQRELAAGLVTFQDHGLQIGARGIDRGSQARTPTPDDDDVLHEQ